MDRYHFIIVSRKGVRYDFRGEFCVHKNITLKDGMQSLCAEICIQKCIIKYSILILMNQLPQILCRVKWTSHSHTQECSQSVTSVHMCVCGGWCVSVSVFVFVTFIGISCAHDILSVRTLQFDHAYFVVSFPDVSKALPVLSFLLGK